MRVLDMLMNLPPALIEAAGAASDAERAARAAGASEEEAKRAAGAAASAVMLRAADEEIDPDPERAAKLQKFLRQLGEDLAEHNNPNPKES